jgi:peptidoglycan/LPS O-acetylase OafA/YrhL
VSIQLDSALAIKCFFVMSGFYMAMLLDGAYRTTPRAST